VIEHRLSRWRRPTTIASNSSSTVLKSLNLAGIVRLSRRAFSLNRPSMLSPSRGHEQFVDSRRNWLSPSKPARFAWGLSFGGVA
jgi:hypothetical protein